MPEADPVRLAEIEARYVSAEVQVWADVAYLLRLVNSQRTELSILKEELNLT